MKPRKTPLFVEHPIFGFNFKGFYGLSYVKIPISNTLYNFKERKRCYPNFLRWYIRQTIKQHNVSHYLTE